jgi:hypothetical protein
MLQTCLYRPGQTIYVRVPGVSTPEGPYKIETVAGNGRYTLCDANGDPARNGNVIDEADLTTSST